MKLKEKVERYGIIKGDEVEKGTKIAKVGSTGNSTGPHLHFEIRYQDRYVNPQEIFQFE